MICGIDEAGRGCVAGDLCIAGCVLRGEILGLKDSKKLNEKMREKLYEKIIANAESSYLAQCKLTSADLARVCVRGLMRS